MFGVETTSSHRYLQRSGIRHRPGPSGKPGAFASGVMLPRFQPYKVGDLVNIGGGQNGTVEGIQVFNTVLKTLDNSVFFVPMGSCPAMSLPIFPKHRM